MLDPSFFSYVTVMSITPGPNNLLLATSGVNFGMRRTLPMMFGILLGCAVQTVIAGMALEVLLHWMSAIRLPLTLAGCTYLLWLSWKIFRAAAPETRTRPQPITLLGGACFQAINPKAWLMALGAVASFSLAGDAYRHSIAAISIGMFMVNLLSGAIWMGFGAMIGRILRSRRAWKIFNLAMGLLTAACVLLIWH